MIAFDWPDIQIFSLATLQAAGVFQGGLILALMTAIIYIRHNKMPALQVTDAFAPGIAIRPRHRPPRMFRRRMLLG